MNKPLTRDLDINGLIVDQMQASREFCVEYLKAIDEDRAEQRNAVLEEAAEIAEGYNADEIASDIRAAKRVVGTEK